MPRGIKGSGKAKAGVKTDRMASVKTENTEGTAQVEPTAAVTDTAKGRKPYPTHEERLAAAEKQIERLTKLNAERTALIEKNRGHAQRTLRCSCQERSCAGRCESEERADHRSHEQAG